MLDDRAGLRSMRSVSCWSNANWLNAPDLDYADGHPNMDDEDLIMCRLQWHKLAESFDRWKPFCLALRQ